MKKKNINYIYITIMVVLMVVFVSLMICEWVAVLNEDKWPFFTTEFAKMALSVFQTILIAFLVTGELRRNSRITQQSLDLESQGILGVNKNGVLKPREIDELFTYASLIKIMGVCSKNFLSKNQKQIEAALKRGCEIRLLIANENSEFVKETTEQLEATKSREYNEKNNQAREIEWVKKQVGKWQKFGNISVRQFNTEFRAPFYLGYFEEGDYDVKVKGWYNSVIPVCSPREVLMFKGEILDSERDKYITPQNEETDGEKYNYSIFKRETKKRNIVVDLECHFDYLWHKYKDKNKTVEDYLAYALEETKKLLTDEVFIVKDLFKEYEWNRISIENRRELGRQFYEIANKINYYIKPLEKTDLNQQKYVKLEKEDSAI